MPNDAPVLLAVDDALRRILDCFETLDAETVALADAPGRVLATDMQSRLTLPSSDVSAMDGYAVRAADVTSLPVTLSRVGESAAGHPWAGTLGTGQAVRIFTGAIMPAGSDTVLLQEDVDAEAEHDGSRITLREIPTPRQFVRPAGLDVTAGDIILPKGSRISARSLALAISTGHVSADVCRKPRIGILSTGDELTAPGSLPQHGQIISSNAAYLTAFVTACGGEAVPLGIAPDRKGAMPDAINACPVALDMIVTTGGASVGTHDHVASDLGQDGNNLDFWKIAMRPGKPLIFGQINGVPLLGLPGNPVSSAVCALVFLRPAMAKMTGYDGGAVIIQGELTAGLAENDRRQDYLRVCITYRGDNQPLITPASKQDSSMMGVLARSHGLAIRPPFDPALEKGQTITVMLFPDLL